MKRIAIVGMVLCLTACNADEPPPNTGGVDLADGPCGRGLAVVSSDYQSTNVSIIDVDGNVVSSSFISSASEDTGLSAPLSGDVAAPNQRLSGSDLVLIDRFPSSVITWIDLESARVRAQLDVSTGFAANPRDYLQLDDGRAYVTRFETNPTPGAVEFDGGGDILIVDPTASSIIGRIDLTPAMEDAPGFLPRASRMIVWNDEVTVLLLGYDQDFSDAAPSRLVRIRDDEITGVIVLPGMYGCEGLAADGASLAVACSGRLAGGSTTDLEGAGLALVRGSDITVFTADDLIGQPLGFTAAFTDQGLLVTALGSFDTGALDAVLHVTEEGAVDTVLSSASRPFEIGEIRCACDCFVADAERAVLHRLDGASGAAQQALPLEDAVGLPPRTLSRF